MKPKLRTNREWKNTFEAENYIKLNLTRSQRSITAQLRGGCLPLLIETGRYRGVKLEDKICPFCDRNEVETEYHFILYCILYENRVICLQRPDLITHLVINK